jgi:hypothetical protein
MATATSFMLRVSMILSASPRGSVVPGWRPSFEGWVAAAFSEKTIGVSKVILPALTASRATVAVMSFVTDAGCQDLSFSWAEITVPVATSTDRDGLALAGPAAEIEKAIRSGSVDRETAGM